MCFAFRALLRVYDEDASIGIMWVGSSDAFLSLQLVLQWSCEFVGSAASCG